VEDFVFDAAVLWLASVLTVKKLVTLNSDDVGNSMVTIMSLMFMRIRSFAVNATKVSWKERAIYSWSSLLWFTSFHTSGSTMMANKRNMVLETIGVLFLVTRKDVSQPRPCTSESNEHTYGFWRMILREFNMEQVIRIVGKTNIRLDAIFEGNLVTSRSHTSFKGYQQTIPDFLKNLRATLNVNASGPVDVNLDEPAVNQLWDEVKGIIQAVNSWMIPFLKIFDVEEGNGLSPFAIQIDTPHDLRKLVDQFFCPPRRDMRDVG